MISKELPLLWGSALLFGVILGLQQAAYPVYDTTSIELARDDAVTPEPDSTTPGSGSATGIPQHCASREAAARAFVARAAAACSDVDNEAAFPNMTGLLRDSGSGAAGWLPNLRAAVTSRSFVGTAVPCLFLRSYLSCSFVVLSRLCT